MTLRSVWQQRHDVEVSVPVSATAEVAGQWDVIVIGAGISGLSTAVLLGRAGRSVLVLEARRVGAGTTGGSTAKVSLLQGTQLTNVARHHSTSILTDYVGANLEAQAWLARFCADHGVDVQRRTAFTYATTARGERSARAELEHAQRAGLPAAWFDEVGLPFATRGAIGLADQLQVDPVALLDALRGAAVEQGSTVVEGARVTRVHGHAPVTVVTDSGEARAATVVVATNTPVLDRGGYFARVTAARSYGLAFRTRAPAVDAMYLSTDQPSRSLRDAEDGEGSLLLVGGNGHPTGRARSPRGRLEEIRVWTRDHFEVLDEVSAWSAQDYKPHHGLPYAGPLLPGRDDVLLTGGYSKWGMTNGVAAAHAVTGRLLGHRPGWSGAFDSWAVRELKGLPTAARANAEVGLAMTTGWLRTLPRPTSAPPPLEGEGDVRRGGLSGPVAVSTTSGVTRRTSAVCTHLGGIVAWNDAERSWDCPLHGSRFDADGTVLEGVATCGLARHQPSAPIQTQTPEVAS